MLKGKNVVLGVTGGIAAYKAADVASRLVKTGADVKVIMTEDATRFIAPETFRAIVNNRVYTSVFDEKEEGVAHIELARNADAVLVAPATANFIGKAACGIADDMLSTVVLAAHDKKIIIAPAMNCHMYENPIVQENLKRLMERGFVVIEPESGHLACGEDGKGRLPQPEDIVERVFAEIAYEKNLAGKRVVVTAGATQEALDPVRYVTNHSSGKMGYALAKIARAKGAEVTLISGVTSLKKPIDVNVIDVVSARDMYEKAIECFDDCDIMIKAAAVADYRPKSISEQKIKKREGALVLELERTDDILAQLGKRKKGQILVGFCMETEKLVESAKRKLKDKNLDMVCANSLNKEGAGFGTDTNIITLINKSGNEEELPIDTKENLAAEILDRAAELLK
ncbi:MAG: bifunctional phosphopantothenoylcysteine decarboxylase/phosphopantothenate--cysteine ligase CoaBC [Clostridia bacterium]|nr:bifunctional phosphopantothenoylcysteine decarboxylase/phosphopantothenate--cysteine ligase CoaBC [Clostridia bacterium]